MTKFCQELWKPCEKQMNDRMNELYIKSNHTLWEMRCAVKDNRGEAKENCHQK